MFHIVKHKSTNVHMRWIFIYLFLKSLTSEFDLYIILYTEQKSEHNRENYSSIGNGWSTQTNETNFFNLIKTFFSKYCEALKVHWEMFSLSQPLHWCICAEICYLFIKNSWVPNISSSSFSCDWNIIFAILIWEAEYGPGYTGHIVKSKLDLIITCLYNSLESNLL